jgi:hypothetical protein
MVPVPNPIKTQFKNRRADTPTLAEVFFDVKFLAGIIPAHSIASPLPP